MLKLREIIDKSKQIHGNKYDYSLVPENEYKNTKTKCPIICHEKNETGHEHGVFYMDFAHHIYRKQGCPKCKSQKLSKLFSITKEQFINKAALAHDNKYSYLNIDVELKNTNSIITINCPVHGEFKQKVHDHLNGRGCQKCAKNQPLITEEFVKKSTLIHGDKYRYSAVNYQNYNSKVCIICPKHGEFWQSPDIHLSGCGCPKCGKIQNSLSRHRSEQSIIEQMKKQSTFYTYENVHYNGYKTK